MAVMLGGTVLATEQTPCTEDIAKYCKDAGKGRGALLRCLEEHETELSDACKEYEAKLETARTESREAGRRQMRIRAACRDEVLQFCGDSTSGGGAVITCLRGHIDDLSGPCGDAVRAAQRAEQEEKK